MYHNREMSLIEAGSKLFGYWRHLKFPVESIDLGRDPELDPLLPANLASACESIVHEMSHILLLYDIERLYVKWSQVDLDYAFDQLTAEDEGQNEIETTALAIMFGRAIKEETIEQIARHNLELNLPYCKAPCKAPDDYSLEQTIQEPRIQKKFEELFNFILKLDTQ